MQAICDRMCWLTSEVDHLFRAQRSSRFDWLWYILNCLWFKPFNDATGRSLYHRPQVWLEQSGYSCLTHARGVGGEYAVRRILREKGHEVTQTNAHGPDLIVNGDVYVEVKTGGWRKTKGGNSGRYGFGTRWSSTTRRKYRRYVLVLRCLSSPPCHFVIPRQTLLERQQSIIICTQDAMNHTGKWREFKEAWDLIDPCLERTD